VIPDAGFLIHETTKLRALFPLALSDKVILQLASCNWHLASGILCIQNLKDFL